MSNVGRGKGVGLRAANRLRRLLIILFSILEVISTNAIAPVAAVCDRRFPALLARSTALTERRYIYEMGSRACNRMTVEGRARHSVRAALCQPDHGAHRVTRPTSHCQKLILIQALNLWRIRLRERSSLRLRTEAHVGAHAIPMSVTGLATIPPAGQHEGRSVPNPKAR
jgi:hypothetical protein